MALSGKELVRCVGIINSGSAAVAEYVTTQNIANLNTTSAVAPSAPLTGLEPVACYGPSGAGIPSAVPFFTTTGSIQALGSVGATTLTGNEIIELEPPVQGQAPAAVRPTTTALKIAG